MCVSVRVCVHVRVHHLQVLRWLTVCRSTVPHPSPPPRLPPAGVEAQEGVTLLRQALYQLRVPQVAHTHTCSLHLQSLHMRTYVSLWYTDSGLWHKSVKSALNLPVKRINTAAMSELPHPYMLIGHSYSTTTYIYTRTPQKPQWRAVVSDEYRRSSAGYIHMVVTCAPSVTGS